MGEGGDDNDEISLHLPRRYLDAPRRDIVEHIAGVENYQVALATFRAACERWRGTPITLRQGACVIEDSRRQRTV